MEDTMYTIDGHSVHLTQRLEDGRCVVEYIYEEDEEIYRDHRPFVIDEVFEKPPTEKYNRKIQDLTKAIESLQESRREVESLLKSEEKAREEKLKKFKKVEQLSFLEDFIDGKITHYVENKYSHIDIIKFEDTKGPDHDRRDRFRLLSLFGRADGELEWNLNEYTDGSGTDREVIPCLSYEMAVEEAQKSVDRRVKEKSRLSGMEYVIKSADKHGLLIPDEYRKNYKDKLIDSTNEDLKKKTEEADKLRKKLVGLRK